MQHLQPNTILQGGKYRIERVLGQGGFGITYLAEQVSLKRKVAIKEFFMKDYCARGVDTRTMTSPSTGSNNLVEQYRKKFVKEAQNLAKLHHPNISSVIEVFEENDTVYYSMPYLSGGSLYDLVKANGALTEDVAMNYIRQIAKALKYMHEEKHLCHYDVKPSNILLDGSGKAVLIDFGISKNYDTSGHETSTTPIGLSEGYAPIEQYQQNIAEFSPASDVYALGATLYFLLHGRTPISAPSRAGGTALLMRTDVSQNTKDLITASMKISKTERAQKIGVFLNHGSQQPKGATDNPPAGDGYDNNTFIGWILGIAVVAIIGFFIFNNQGVSDKSVDMVETPLPPIEQAQETTTDIYKERVGQFARSQSGVVASYPDKRYSVYYYKKDEYGRKYLYHYDAIADSSEKMDLPIEATNGDYTDLWVTKNRYIFIAAEYRYTDFIRIDTETGQIKYITDCSSVKRTSKGFTVVKSECINEYDATCEADKEYAFTDFYYNEEGINTGQGQQYR